MLQIKARAKINLVLDILGQRPDGYHELATIMQTLALHDVVQLTHAPQIGLQVKGADVPGGPDNLAWQAARLLRQKAGYPAGATITLVKNIPVAAGLAGGSSDAAAVLVGLNQLWGLGLNHDQLSSLGATIGSDVPFCLRGGTALATGRGEIIKQLPDLPALGVLLVKPHFGVSTAQVYDLYDDIKQTNYHRQKPGCPAMLEAVNIGDVAKITTLLSNHLESVTTSLHPAINKIKQYLAQTKAQGVLMSGSGPTVFGLYANKQLAQGAAAKLPTGDYSVHVTEFSASFNVAN